MLRLVRNCLFNGYVWPDGELGPSMFSRTERQAQARQVQADARQEIAELAAAPPTAEQKEQATSVLTKDLVLLKQAGAQESEIKLARAALATGDIGAAARILDQVATKQMARLDSLLGMLMNYPASGTDQSPPPAATPPAEPTAAPPVTASPPPQPAEDKAPEPQPQPQLPATQAQALYDKLAKSTNVGPLADRGEGVHDFLSAYQKATGTDLGVKEGFSQLLLGNREAIERLQQELKLPATGHWDAATREAAAKWLEGSGARPHTPPPQQQIVATTSPPPAPAEVANPEPAPAPPAVSAAEAQQLYDGLAKSGKSPGFLAGRSEEVNAFLKTYERVTGTDLGLAHPSLLTGNREAIRRLQEALKVPDSGSWNAETREAAAKWLEGYGARPPG